MLLLAFCSLWCSTSAFASSLSASWEYQGAGSSDSDETTSDLLQRYNLNLGTSREHTDAISSGVNLGYVRFDSIDLPLSETISPSASLRLRNDLFLWDLSGTRSLFKSSDSDDNLNTWSWQTSLRSNADFDYFLDWQLPAIVLDFGKSGSYTDEKVIDNFERHYGLGLSWEFPFADLRYRYRNTRAEDLFIDTTVEGSHIMLVWKLKGGLGALGECSG